MMKNRRISFMNFEYLFEYNARFATVVQKQFIWMKRFYDVRINIKHSMINEFNDIIKLTQKLRKKMIYRETRRIFLTNQAKNLFFLDDKIMKNSIEKFNKKWIEIENSNAIDDDEKLHYDMTNIYLNNAFNLEWWYEHTSLNINTPFSEYKHILLRIQAHPRTFFFSEEISARAYLDQTIINLDQTNNTAYRVRISKKTSLFERKVFFFNFSNFFVVAIIQTSSSQCLYYLHQTNKSLNLWRISCFALTSMSLRKIMLWCCFVQRNSSLKSKKKSELSVIVMKD
jgi:hypothetical protein